MGRASFAGVGGTPHGGDAANPCREAPADLWPKATPATRPGGWGRWWEPPSHQPPPAQNLWNERKARISRAGGWNSAAGRTMRSTKRDAHGVVCDNHPPGFLGGGGYRKELLPIIEVCDTTPPPAGRAGGGEGAKRRGVVYSRLSESRVRTFSVPEGGMGRAPARAPPNMAVTRGRRVAPSPRNERRAEFEHFPSEARHLPECERGMVRAGSPGVCRGKGKAKRNGPNLPERTRNHFIDF